MGPYETHILMVRALSFPRLRKTHIRTEHERNVARKRTEQLKRPRKVQHARNTGWSNGREPYDHGASREKESGKAAYMVKGGR